MPSSPFRSSSFTSSESFTLAQGRFRNSCSSRFSRTRGVPTRYHTGVGPLDVQDLPQNLDQVMPQVRGKSEFSRFLEMKYLDACSAFDREYFSSFMDACGGNLSRAAEAMGIHRQTLQYRLKQSGLRKKWIE